jgi:hypothetical protein
MSFGARTLVYRWEGPDWPGSAKLIVESCFKNHEERLSVCADVLNDSKFLSPLVSVHSKSELTYISESKLRLITIAYFNDFRQFSVQL